MKLGEILRVQGRLSTFADQIQVTVSSLREHSSLCSTFRWSTFEIVSVTYSMIIQWNAIPASDLMRWWFQFCARGGARSKCRDATLDGMHAVGKMLLRPGSSLTNKISQFLMMECTKRMSSFGAIMCKCTYSTSLVSSFHYSTFSFCSCCKVSRIWQNSESYRIQSFTEYFGMCITIMYFYLCRCHNYNSPTLARFLFFLAIFPTFC